MGIAKVRLRRLPVDRAVVGTVDSFLWATLLLPAGVANVRPKDDSSVIIIILLFYYCLGRNYLVQDST